MLGRAHGPLFPVLCHGGRAAGPYASHRPGFWIPLLVSFDPLFVPDVQTIWRLEKKRHIETAFYGKNSLRSSGHWHHEGVQVAYASEHPGVAVLEKLVWLDSYEAARGSDYVLLPLHLDPSDHLEELDPAQLPEHWDTFPHPEETRDLGTRWVEEERSVVLAVPSAIVPTASNYLINPSHADIHALEQGDPIPFSWDPRLFRRLHDIDDSEAGG